MAPTHWTVHPYCFPALTIIVFALAGVVDNAVGRRRIDSIDAGFQVLDGLGWPAFLACQMGQVDLRGRVLGPELVGTSEGVDSRLERT